MLIKLAESIKPPPPGIKAAIADFKKVVKGYFRDTRILVLVLGSIRANWLSVYLQLLTGRFTLFRG
jgi:Zn/Cd-binding protein ZinT